MFNKRRITFSIGAMLVLMTGVAVLLNHEVQRARAIETTVKKIDEWHGQLTFRPRANIPRFLSNVMPDYWTVEIDRVAVRLYSKNSSTPVFRGADHAVIDPSEFEKLLKLETLDDLAEANLRGTAIRHAAVSRICKSDSLQQCFLLSLSLTDDEIADLKVSCPQCTFHSDIFD